MLRVVSIVLKVSNSNLTYDSEILSDENKRNQNPPAQKLKVNEWHRDHSSSVRKNYCKKRTLNFATLVDGKISKIAWQN